VEVGDYPRRAVGVVLRQEAEVAKEFGNHEAEKDAFRLTFVSDDKCRHTLIKFSLLYITNKLRISIYTSMTTFFEPKL